MNGVLSGVKVAVLGGDDRELVLIPELVKLGADVRVAGYPPREEIKGAVLRESVVEAISGVDAIILPMPGTDDHGVIRAVYTPNQLVITEELLSAVPSKVPIFIGVAKPFLRGLAKKLGLRLIEIGEMDELAILNSIPSAEGAIQIAMQELPITIHDSQSLVVGFGRVGQTLARMLAALGAHTAIVARKPADLARGYELGYRCITYDQLTENIAAMDLIFNTVPAMILHEGILKNVSRNALIIDLATQPGGTDFQSAARLGVKAILAPGLPGKVAPVTAGRILARVLPGLILKEIATTD
ncbi:dipicolinate synthase [Clostridiales bacterium PH28_bin88]|nr:dipicolinate synthase [Clostridiales bacterium PH28_bin88]